MLHKLREAVGFLNILSEKELLNMFEHESKETEQPADALKEEQYSLSKLVDSTDGLVEESNLKRRLAPKDVEVLGRFGVEDEARPKWIEEGKPRPNFGIRYSWEYSKAVIKYCIENPNTPIELRALLSVPHRRMAYLLTDMYTLIRCVVSESEDKDKWIRRIKNRISRDIRTMVKEQKYEQDDRFVLAFYLDSLFLVLSVQACTVERTYEENRKEARKYLSYYLANGMWSADQNPAEALTFAKDGIALSYPADRQDAFNILGLCALETRGGKQLAYDTYLSWIKKEPVGLLQDFWRDGFEIDGNEDVWRQEKGNEASIATMYNNYAYVCDSIAATYELRSPERKRFQEIAIQNIIAAIEMDADPRYYRTYGLILADMNTPDKSSDESLKQYEEALRRSDSLKERLPLMRLCCDAMIDNLLAMLMNSRQAFRNWSEQSGMQYYEKLKMRFQEYRQMLDTAQEDSLAEEMDKRNALRAFLNVQEMLQETNDGPLELALLLVGQLTFNIKKFLRRNAYSSKSYYTRDKRKDANVAAHREPGRSIAYYTTLKTAMYLFNVLYRTSKDTAPVPIKPDHPEYSKGVNCLTMMQAYYMNDPYEGLSFERGISSGEPSKNILFYRGNAWRFREDIFQNHFVFLKSFTHQMDNLLMWNRYGSDRESGSRDSNGCCIRFDPEFFDRVNDSDTADASRNLLVDKKDDYGLHRVVYLNQKGEIDSDKNPNLDINVRRCYTLLKQLLQYVNGKLCDFSEDDPNDPRIGIVRSFVQAALNPVIFLFKDDEYSDEEEYRLVVSRSHNDLENVYMIPGEPEKACVNPYFQVCIDKVVLGPNVENPEHWFNHFRYHIAKMWRRALGPNEQIPRFTVEKSSIHYHT